MKLLKGTLHLLPLLVLYIAVIGILGAPEPEGDGIRYYAAANHYLSGHLADPVTPNIRNGPIYPLLLVPIVWLNLPVFFVYLMNAFLLLGAAFFLHKLLKNWLKPGWALAATYIVVLYPPLLLEMPRVAYESLTVFLVSAYLFHSYQIFQEEKAKHIWYAAFSLAVLALTKLIFPYVIFTLIAVSVFFFFLKRSSATQNFLKAQIFACLFLLPYLFMTYQLTGKTFFWTNSGGEIMYWKTSPYEEEFGDWYQPAMVSRQTGLDALDSCGKLTLFERHSEFFQKMEELKPIEMNEALSKKASEQRKAHPKAFIKNSVASFSRLFFNFPFSYTRQKLTTLPFILLNMFVLVLSIFGLIIVAMRMKALPTYFWLSLVMALVYIGGMTLLNGRVRHLIPILPIILVVLSYVFSQLIEIRWKPLAPENN